MLSITNKSTALSLTCALLLSLLISLSLARTYFSRQAASLRKLPGPWYSKFTNLRLKAAIITGQRIHYVHALHSHYGPYVRIAPTEVSVADPEAFNQIHKAGSGFRKSNWYRDLVMFERLTVFTMTDAKQHAARRKLFARAFSKSSLRVNWEGVVMEKVRLAVARIKEEARGGGGGGKVDVFKWWNLFATDTSGNVMFGESFGMLELGKITDYVRVLGLALIGGGIGAELPVVSRIGRMLPFKTTRELFGASAYLQDYANVAVRNMKSRGGNTNIFAMINSEAEKGETQLDNLDVQLEASGLVVAGSDTTAITLTYLIWAVLSTPDLQILLQNEVAALPANFADVDVEGLPIVNAVIEETLRLYGAAPGGLPRIVPSSGASMGGYYLADSVTVTTQSFSLHRDPSLFPDPLTFDYTRWLAENEKNISSLAKSAFSPFGGGSRICLGIHLARMELRLAVAEFFRVCKDAKLAPSATPQSMAMLNFFLIAPAAHKCEIVLKDGL